MINIDLSDISSEVPSYIKDFDFSYIARYKIIAALIQEVDSAGTSKILDVGGYNSPIQKLFQKAQITILDVVDSKEKNYVKASGSKMPFEDNSFDIVITSDTLEHIPDSERDKFISELIRVSKNYIFLGAPFGSQKVIDAERIADGFYTSMTGESYMWLKEHKQFGLPKKDWLRKILSQQKVNYFDFDHTSIDVWTLMICGSFFLANNIGGPQPNLGAKLKKGNERYLKDMAFRDFPKEGYRTFFVISKKSPVKVVLPDYFKDEINDFTDKEISLIGKTIQEFSKNFGITEHEVFELHKQNHSLDQENKQLRAELTKIRNSRTYKLASNLSRAKNYTVNVRKKI